MRREHRVISALHGSAVPVPTAIDVVDDTADRHEEPHDLVAAAVGLDRAVEEDVLDEQRLERLPIRVRDRRQKPAHASEPPPSAMPLAMWRMIV